MTLIDRLTSPLRALYDWTLMQAQKPYALWMLAFISFAESSFFPIPAEVLMLPMLLAQKERWLLIATVGCLSSVAGGMFGYFIGYALFETFGEPLLAFYGAEAVYAHYAARYDELGWWIVFIGGFTPVPYKAITITSGAAQLNFGVFIAASLLSRGLRMFGFALLMRFCGAWVRQIIERWFGPLSLLAVALLIGGFYVLKLL